MDWSQVVELLRLFDVSFDHALPQDIHDRLITTRDEINKEGLIEVDPIAAVWNYSCEGVMGELLPLSGNTLSLARLAGVTKFRKGLPEMIHDAITFAQGRK